MSEKILNKILDRIPNWQKIYYRLAMDLTQHINELMKKDGKSQVGLARMLGKHESEISKWLSGNHNFTLKSLAKLEDILESRVIFVPNEIQGYIMKSENKYTTNAVSADRDKSKQISDQMLKNKKPMFARTITLRNKALSYQNAA